MTADELSFLRVLEPILLFEQRNTSTVTVQTDRDSTLEYPPNAPEAQLTLKLAMNRIHAKRFAQYDSFQSVTPHNIK